MFKLVVNPGTEQAWEIPLGEGVTTLGSNPGNAIVLAHESVSGRHCEIHVTGSQVALHELGSPAGTAVGDRWGEPTPLAPGQRFRAGEIELELVAVHPPTHAPTTGAVGSEPAPQPCRHHPRAVARWRCPRCGHWFCELCVNIRSGGERSNHFCRRCGSECESVVALPVGGEKPKEFFARLPGAFSYPFTGNGVILLVAGTLFFAFLDLIQFLGGMLGPYGFVVGWIFGVLATGYLFNYAKSIITRSAAGDTTPPDWPDLSDWQQDLAVPFGQLLALVVLSFGPAAILAWWQPGSETFARAITLAAMAVGALLAPMGMLALAMFDSVAALNPVALVWSILRVPVAYLVAAAAFELVLGVYLLADGLITWLLPVPILPGLLSGFINLYLIVVGTRILGLLYQSNKERLGWF